MTTEQYMAEASVLAARIGGQETEEEARQVAEQARTYAALAAAQAQIDYWSALKRGAPYAIPPGGKIQTKDR